jgi:monomeric isocitrate dehydrogenase
MNLEKQVHKVRNITNVKHRVSKEPLSLHFLDLETKEIIKKYSTQNFCTILESKLNRREQKEVLYSVHAAKTMAIVKHTAGNPTTA